MARQYGIHYKYCACCAYWLGRRDTDHFGNYAIVDSGEKARCMCKRSSWKNQERSAESTCTWFELWPVMK